MTTQSFSETVRAYAEPFWRETVEHEFVQEMVTDRLSKDAFRHYLIQDYAFFRHFTDLVSYAIVHAKTMEQMHHLSGFLSVVTDGENDYFLRSFAELGVSEDQYLDPTLNPVMQGFADTIKKATETGYHDCIIVLACAEWTYWTWGDACRQYQPEAFYFNEWITLHNNPEFEQFVIWLRGELDAMAELPEAEQQRLKELFRHCCTLERDFFTYAYEQG